MGGKNIGFNEIESNLLTALYGDKTGTYDEEVLNLLGITDKAFCIMDGGPRTCDYIVVNETRSAHGWWDGRTALYTLCVK